MQKIVTILFISLVSVSAAVSPVFSQQTDTTKPVSIDPELENLYKQKVPKQYKIAEVTVTGAEYFDKSLILSIANITTGDEVLIPGGDIFAKAIRKLWDQNYFADVQVFITKVADRNIYVEIHVEERPRLKQFNFKGISKSQADDLKEKSGLVVNRIVTENMKETAKENIQKFYYEKGFRNVHISVQETPDISSPNFVNLLFLINRGPKVHINQISFAGNENISALRLKKQMKGSKEMSRLSLTPIKDTSVYAKVQRMTFKEYLNEAGPLSLSKTKEILDPYFRFKLFSSSKFNQTKYQEDKEKIINYYNSLGYRDALIEEDTIYQNDRGNLNVDIKLNEGHKYYFGNIAWKGNTKYPDSILNLILGIKKGDIYDLQTLNRRLGKELTPEGGDISGLYMDDGYLWFRTEVNETAVYNDTIDHEIRIIEGPQATIKNVNISGNDKTKEHVIRRELRTVPGEKFSRTDLIRSQREIAQLGFFDQEKIGINPVPNIDDGTVDINYTLEEKSSDQLELSAGWGGGIGLTGTLGVTFNNFSIRNIFKSSSWDPLPSGDGQKLSIRVQSNGKAFRSYNFSFTEPWLGGKKRNSFTVSLYNTKFSNAIDPYTGFYSKNRSDTSYLRTIGGGISLGKQLKWPDDYFSLIYSLNYTQYKLRNYAIFPELNNGTSNNISLKIALIRSSVDQPLFPRSGSTFQLSAQFTPPYSWFRDKSIYNEPSEKYKWVEFHKWRFNAEWYVPIGKAMGAEKNRQFVLKVAAKYGFMGRYSRFLEISPFERFQLGDAGLTNNFGILGYDIIAHRGYPVYETSDPRVNPDQSNANRFFTMFNKYTLELRYPFSTNPSSTIYGLTFFEAANGWYDFKDYNPFKLRRSVGVGMRFFLPMFGLLGFDYGIGLDRYNSATKLKDAARFTFMLGYEPE